MAKEAGESRGSRGENSKSSSAPFFPLPPLSPFNIPFVVKSESVIRADLTKLPVTMFETWQEKHFAFDEQYVEYVKAKLEQLRQPHLSHVYVTKRDEIALIECAKRIFRTLAAEYPEYVGLENSVVTLRLLNLNFHLETFAIEKTESTFAHVRGEQSLTPTNATDVYDYLQSQQGIRRIWDVLALAVQEDLVIMKDDGESGISELMHVCFPSHWNPGERVGQSLYGLHQPVVNNKQLLKASRNTLQAMVSKGPFIRFVWSFDPTDDLSQNPAFHTHGRKKPLGDDPSTWFFRVERQTTLPIPDLQRSLFTIRVFVAPLSSVLTAERKKIMEASVLSMTDEFLKYKGLLSKRDVLLGYLRS